MSGPVSDESGQTEEERTPERPYRQDVVVPRIPNADTYRTEPAIDNAFATLDEIEE